MMAGSAAVFWVWAAGGPPTMSKGTLLGGWGVRDAPDEVSQSRASYPEAPGGVLFKKGSVPPGPAAPLVCPSHILDLT